MVRFLGFLIKEIVFFSLFFCLQEDSGQIVLVQNPKTFFFVIKILLEMYNAATLVWSQMGALKCKQREENKTDLRVVKRTSA